ncbi:class II aldolase/adducin family protein, partial [Bacillus paralicheniformis]|uniref:class II aldolase/adducin family protein n=1 Tax=Bacillus paralicheniformis TaxID=1648923 RepID=UPI0020BF732C
HLGVPVLETELRPSAETVLLTHIYNNTNAGCVLHVHTTDNNVITNLYNDAVTLQNQAIIKALDVWEEGAT